MKNTRLNKSIKIFCLISFVLVTMLIFGLSVFAVVNWDAFPETRDLIYDLAKYVSCGILTISIIPIILLIIKHVKSFTKQKYDIYCLIKIFILLTLLIISILFLFIYSKKYFVKVEIWYGHIHFYISLMVIISCLFFSFFYSNQIKNVRNISNYKNLSAIEYCLKKIDYIIPVIWIGVGSISGIVLMFFNKKISQITMMWIMVLLIYITVEICLCFIINHKQHNAKINNKNNTCITLLLVVSCVITIFVTCVYFVMYPVRIIDVIHLNKYLAGSAYICSLCLTLWYIINMKKCWIS